MTRPRIFRPAPKNPGKGVAYGVERWRQMRDGAELFADLLCAPIEKVAIENPPMHGYAAAAIATYLINKGAAALVHHSGAVTPTQTIQPYQFGDDASKRTAFWLRGLAPLVIPHESEWVAPRLVCPKCNRTAYPPDYLSSCYCGASQRSKWRRRWANQTDSGQNKLTPSETRARDRSVTYPGIARAMAMQWGGDAR